MYYKSKAKWSMGKIWDSGAVQRSMDRPLPNTGADLCPSLNFIVPPAHRWTKAQKHFYRGPLVSTTPYFKGEGWVILHCPTLYY